jgi:hypothetical protein
MSDLENSHVLDDRPDLPAQPAIRPRGRPAPREYRIEDLARWFFTHNPFYAISASLVFWGLRSSFDTDAYTFHAYALMAGLVAYTLLLAVTTYVVIRFGKVWEDGRSQLLLVVLMFVAISISFDGALGRDFRIGAICDLAGLGFALLVSEGLLRGLSLRLPAGFRLPYYLLLALFFLYPVAVRWSFPDWYDPRVPWALAAFPVLGGLVFLTLLPAICRGSGYVRDNGSPWPWPWYPWVLFLLLGLGVCGRSYYLCVSMHQAGGFTTVFAPYFLVPPLLAGGILLLEIGLVARSRTVVQAAMLMPVALVLLAMISPSGKLSTRFLQTLTDALGASPLWMTAVAIAAFYAWTAWRRVPLAVDILCAALAGLVIIGPRTVNVDTLADPCWLPIVVVGLVQGWIAAGRRSGLRWLLAGGCIVAALMIALRDTGFNGHYGAAPAHLFLGVLLVVGALARGPLGRLLQHVGAVAILGATTLVLVGGSKLLDDVPSGWLIAYPAMAITLAILYGWLVSNWIYFATAAACLACWAGSASTHAYRQLRQTMAGLDYILWGLAFLLVALLISLLKTDLGNRLLARLKERK